MNDPIRPEDIALLLMRAENMIALPAQKERIVRFLREQQGIVDALAQLERDLRALATYQPV